MSDLPTASGSVIRVTEWATPRTDPSEWDGPMVCYRTWSTWVGEHGGTWTPTAFAGTIGRFTVIYDAEGASARYDFIAVPASVGERVTVRGPDGQVIGRGVVTGADGSCEITLAEEQS